MNYLENVNHINEILSNANEHDTVRLINNAKIKGGGSPGEVLAIICSLLKVLEKKFPKIFSLIKEDAIVLFNISKQIGMKIIPNYDLLDELDWE
jgi:hypothetical protein